MVSICFHCILPISRGIFISCWRRCRDFEATQLLNLMPNTGDEARQDSFVEFRELRVILGRLGCERNRRNRKLLQCCFSCRALIPTLEGNPHLEDLVRELGTWKRFSWTNGKHRDMWCMHLEKLDGHIDILYITCILAVSLSCNCMYVVILWYDYILHMSIYCNCLN